MHASSGDYGSVGRVSEGITDRLDLTGYINGYRQNLAERIVLQHPKIGSTPPLMRRTPRVGSMPSSYSVMALSAKA